MDSVQQGPDDEMLGIFDDLCQDESDDHKFDMLDDLISSTPASKVSSSTVPPTSSSDSKVTSSPVGSTSCLAAKVPSLSVSSTPVPASRHSQAGGLRTNPPNSVAVLSCHGCAMLSPSP